MSGISTHVLDTTSGQPAVGMKVHLFLSGEEIGSARTGQDGRIAALLPDGVTMQMGSYRLVFETGDHFPQSFYPEVSISFAVRDRQAHYHVPLLISPFGYTTYRGS